MIHCFKSISLPRHGFLEEIVVMTARCCDRRIGQQFKLYFLDQENESRMDPTVIMPRSFHKKSCPSYAKHPEPNRVRRLPFLVFPGVDGSSGIAYEVGYFKNKKACPT